MSDKHFVGLDLVSLEDKKKMRPISRVTFLLDGENSVTAGDDTGLEITASNPHATQAMANAVLARLRGYQYHAFEAESANLDPAAELGDGITAGGVYSFIGRLNDNGLGYPGIDAPGEAELEDEYPSAGPMTQEFNRKLAQTRSSITKTAEQIRLEVSNEIQGLSASFTVELDGITQRVQGLDGKYSEVQITLDGLTIRDEGGVTRIKGSSIDTGSMAANSIRADQVNLTGSITWGDLSDSVQNDINDAYSMAEDADNIISSWSYTYGKQTYIDGNMLMSGTVMASYLLGGSIGLLDYLERNVGGIDITSTATGYGLSFWTNQGGIRISPSGYFWVDSQGGSFGTTTSGLAVGSDLRPNSSTGDYDLGTSSNAWGTVYAKTGQIVTSDERLKHDIEDIPEKYLRMMDLIPPRRYKLNEGTSGRYHIGFIAQEVDDAMGKAGIDPLEFGGFVKDKDEEGNDVYMLRYDEFIGIIWAKIRRLEKILNILEGAV